MSVEQPDDFLDRFGILGIIARVEGAMTAHTFKGGDAGWGPRWKPGGETAGVDRTLFRDERSLEVNERERQQRAGRQQATKQRKQARVEHAPQEAKPFNPIRLEGDPASRINLSASMTLGAMWQPRWWNA